MHHRRRRLYPALALLISGGLLIAPEEGRAMDTGLDFRWGYDFGYGSKKLVEAANIGFPHDRRSITASEGEFFTLGFALIGDSREFALDASVGIKSATLCDSYDISGGDYGWVDALWPTCAWDATLNAEFFRIPFGLIAAYNGVPGLRLGAGLTYQTSPTLKVDAPLAYYKINFDNALGYVAEVAYTGNSRNPSVYIGARYTWLSYSIDGVEVAKANGAGLFVGLSAW
jgi:hypothetical protein